MPKKVVEIFQRNPSITMICFSQECTEHEDTETDDEQDVESDDDIALAQLIFGKNKPKSDNDELENVSDNGNDSDDDVVLA